MDRTIAVWLVFTPQRFHAFSILVFSMGNSSGQLGEQGWVPAARDNHRGVQRKSWPFQRFGTLASPKLACQRRLASVSTMGVFRPIHLSRACALSVLLIFWLGSGRARAETPPTLAGSWSASPLVATWQIGDWGDKCGPKPGGGG